ncbi:MAG: hypothetical protein AB7J40_04470 [Candidatus Altimarinota bacterium]
MPDRSVSPPPSPLSKTHRWFLLGGAVIAFLIVLNVFLSGQLLQTSTLNTSFNRLSSTEVFFTIPEPGKLAISAGPTNFLSGGNTFALVISSPQATPTNPTTPFSVDPALTSIINQTSTDQPEEIAVALSFPEGRYRTSKNTLVELPFTTTQAGEFEVKSIYFGQASSTTFPPFQEYPIFIASPTIAFDANGAARVTTTTTQPPPTQNPACSDTVDNDNDGKIDHPQDPGCTSANDTDETDPPGLTPLRLDLPAQHLKSIQTIDYRTEIIALLPPAQEQLQYQFTLKAAGGSGNFTFGVRGRTPNSNNAYPLTDSGLVLRSNGLLTGEPDVLKAANYRYPLFVTDGDQTLNFSLQIAVHDAFGNPIGLIIETSFTGTEHYCVVGELCEAFFKAQKGIEPYLYAFSGESPTTSQFLQVNAGQAFYRFTPTAAQVGVYNATVSVTDSSKPAASVQGTTASAPFTLTIEPPEIQSSFKFSAEKSCDFLDLSAADPSFSYFQFTCRNGVMEGSQGLVRAEDSLNRAEAAKITSLIVTEEAQVATVFSPFASLSPATPVNYNDVTVGDWYATFVYYLFKQGIIVDNLLYRPADTLNAAEAMKLVIEAYAPLNDDLALDLLDITDFDEWFEPYQLIASYVDASIAYVDPSLPAKREWIAELLFKLYRSYPVSKFQ